jgi:hypothetical protein
MRCCCPVCGRLHRASLAEDFGVFVSSDLNPNWSSARIYTEYWYDQSLKKS